MIPQVEHTDKKTQILLEAEKLFADQDFEAVSVRDLAKAANVNIAMISYYFGSKEKLFEALIQYRIESSQTIFRSLVTAGMNHTEKMYAVIDYYIDKLIDNRKIHRMINRELSINTRAHLRDMIMEKIRGNRVYIRNIMVEGIRNGEFKPDMDIDITILNFFGTLSNIIGATTYSCDMFDKENEDELFTNEFKDRLKTYFRKQFSYNLL